MNPEISVNLLSNFDGLATLISLSPVIVLIIGSLMLLISGALFKKNWEKVAFALTVFTLALGVLIFYAIQFEIFGRSQSDLAIIKSNFLVFDPLSIVMSAAGLLPDRRGVDWVYFAASALRQAASFSLSSRSIALTAWL